MARRLNAAHDQRIRPAARRRPKPLALPARKLRSQPMTIERRALRPDDVAIRITHSGICHSDLHMARNDWGMSIYPMVPGHEIVGTVTGVGSAVTKFKVGDRAAVGCLVDSDLTCEHCQAGHEQFCRTGC